MRCGSGVDGELTFLDVLSILSFFIGVQNLGLNATQGDMQEATERLDKALRKQVEDIHTHLQKQDEKIDHIIEVIENDEHKKSG